MFGGGLGMAPAHQVIKKLKMDHLWVYTLYPTSRRNGQRNKDSFRGSTALLNKPLTAQGCSDIFSVYFKAYQQTKDNKRRIKLQPRSQVPSPTRLFIETGRREPWERAWIKLNHYILYILYTIY